MVLQGHETHNVIKYNFGRALNGSECFSDVSWRGNGEVLTLAARQIRHVMLLPGRGPIFFNANVKKDN